MIFSDLFFAL